MGYMNQANDISQSKIVTNTFYGLDRRKKIADGAFSDIVNMTTEDYPIIRTRDSRVRTGYSAEIFANAICKSFIRPVAQTNHNEIHQCMVALEDVGDDVYLNYYAMYPQSNNKYLLSNDVAVHKKITQLSPDASRNRHRLVAFGDDVVIFPEGIIYNAHKDTVSEINVVANTPGTGWYVRPCDADGNVYGDIISEGEEEPTEGVEDGGIWIKTETVGGVTTRTVFCYRSSTSSFEIIQPYVRISTDFINFADKVHEGDVISISGLVGAGHVWEWNEYTSGELNLPDGVTKETLQEQFENLNGYHSIVKIIVNDIVVAGIIDTSIKSNLTTEVTFSRTMPDMDYVCECNNRLWGCKYGVVDGAVINELYCCALGDPYNWRKYQGLSTDSWAASCGSDGPWTGCVSYNGYPLFFKENSITKVYISSAGAHQIVTAKAPGMQKPNFTSIRNGYGAGITESGGILYYKGADGVYAYDGGSPTLISAALGTKQLWDASMASHNGIIYMCATDKNQTTGSTGGYKIYEYNTKMGIWSVQDSENALYFCDIPGALFYVDGSPDSEIIAQKLDVEYGRYQNNGIVEEPFDWSLTSGIEYFGDNFNAQYSYRYPPSAMYVTRYVFRLVLAEGSSVKLYIEYDSSGEWIEQGEATGTSGMTVALIPVRPHRCDHLRYKLEGNGYAELWTVSRTLEVGAEV